MLHSILIILNFKYKLKKLIRSKKKKLKNVFGINYLTKYINIIKYYYFYLLMNFYFIFCIYLNCYWFLFNVLIKLQLVVFFVLFFFYQGQGSFENLNLDNNYV